MNKIMSDGKSDGLVLTYVHEGIVYPVSISTEQFNMLNIILPGALDHKINFIKEYPMGGIHDLKEEK